MTDFVIKNDNGDVEVFDPLEDAEPIHVFCEGENPTVKQVLEGLGFDVAVE